jgi:hypothetical protein
VNPFKHRNRNLTFRINKPHIDFELLSGSLNHCNGAERIHNFGDLCKYEQVLQAKWGPGASSGTHPTLETNKQHILNFPPSPAFAQDSWKD